MKIILEGATVDAMDESVRLTGIEPGEIYIAKRNTGWKLLTCKSVEMDCVPDHGEYVNWVNPVEAEYNYDGHECFKVVNIS